MHIGSKVDLKLPRMGKKKVEVFTVLFFLSLSLFFSLFSEGSHSRAAKLSPLGLITSRWSGVWVGGGGERTQVLQNPSARAICGWQCLEGRVVRASIANEQTQGFSFRFIIVTASEFRLLPRRCSRHIIFPSACQSHSSRADKPYLPLPR